MYLQLLPDHDAFFTLRSAILKSIRIHFFDIALCVDIQFKEYWLAEPLATNIGNNVFCKPVVEVIILIFRILFIDIKLWSSEIKISLWLLWRNQNIINLYKCFTYDQGSSNNRKFFSGSSESDKQNFAPVWYMVIRPYLFGVMLRVPDRPTFVKFKLIMKITCMY